MTNSFTFDVLQDGRTGRGTEDRSAGEASAEEGDDLAGLVEAARRGGQYGWDGLIERFTPLIRSIVIRHGLKGQDAEDVHQTVWLRLLEKISDLRDPNSLPGWISTTSRNECVNTFRRSIKVVPIEDWSAVQPEGRDLACEWDDEIIKGEREHALTMAFSELSDMHRKLLHLLLQEPPIPYSEISRMLRIPVGSIGPTRARALNRLRASRSLAAL